MAGHLNPKDYLIEVFYSEEDQAYIAVAPDLPGCSAYADTISEILPDIYDGAIPAWFAACKAAGNTIPEPEAKPRTQGVQP